ncbi:universal stress protein UspA [Halobacteriales archaeon QS_5_70_17]|nr:MAG: universal stress protein UspA [Halobacteriales archaeon QS_5_70_17]
MAPHLLVPMTDDEHSWPGLEYALEYFPEAEITLVNVVDPAGSGYGERTEADRRAEELFDAARERAGGREFDAAVVEGRPADAIVEVAEERGADTIVMGSRGRTGVSRVVLGSVAGTVVQNSPVPVTVVP